MMMKCGCYECGKIVKNGVNNHFTDKDGKILCSTCSRGKKPISDKLKAILTMYEQQEKNLIEFHSND